MQLKTLFCTSIVLSFVSLAAYAQTQTYSNIIGANTLKIVYDSQEQTAVISVNNSHTATLQAVGDQPTLFGPFTTDNQVIEILESESGGTGCPAQFYALWFSPKPILSKPFGNCDDSPSIVHSENGITINMASHDDGVDRYIVNASGVHSFHIPPKEIVSTAPLYSQVLSLKGNNILTLKSMKDALERLIGSEKVQGLSECLISDGPTEISSYVIAESWLPPHNTCDYTPVIFVVDKANNVWISMEGRLDNGVIWYGNPPARVLQAVEKFKDINQQ